MSVIFKIPATVSVSEVSPSLTNIDGAEDKERCAGLACTVTYTNGTACLLAVTERSGLSVNITPSKILNTGEFCIYVNYRFGASASINPYSLVNMAQDELPENLKAIRICLQKSQILERRLNSAIANFEIVYKIPVELLKEHNWMLHVEQLGVTISIPTENEIVVNPDSEKGRFMLDGTVPDIPGFSYRVEINDPEQTYGARYINLNGRVYKIPVTFDRTKRDGVYVYTNANEVKPKGSVKSRYDFFEADNALKLFKTFEEALHYGDIEYDRDKEYERVKHESRMEQIDAEKEKNIFKALMDKFEQIDDANRKATQNMFEFQEKMQKERDEAQKRRDKEEAERRKEEKEEKAHERRERLEYLKWLTAAATAVTAAIIAISKLPIKK